MVERMDYIEKGVRDIVTDVINYYHKGKVNRIGINTPLADYELDSMDVTTIILDLERKFAVRIMEDERELLVSANDIVELIRHKISEK